ncbi:ComEC/rec2 family protein [Vibrio sinaloensis DSM 21326]|uniref:ComEC/rec2 family protein n=1 Tax=Vibrio sinaloensis DSM 21326 TaxID=945550 RepID=E8M2A0_PHOS4|nr:DNA internalization-related competence protein ComEC/Rec2 [Vibrio sinaloensis]EGA71868.1 ComEC/rec2 family protein [Vibrio sinaloensis DSM 21326]
MALLLNYWTLASFSIVIVSASQWPAMPTWHWIVPCIGALFIAVNVRALRTLLGPCCACVVILAHGNLVRHQTVELFKAGSDITINAEVDSFFKQISHGFQGRAVIRSINGERLNIFQRPTVWLRAPVRLSVGDLIQVKVRLKPVIGTLNQVGFDVEKLAYVRSIRARATVVEGESYYITSTLPWRTSLFQRVGTQTQHLPHQGLIKALLFGVRDSIPESVQSGLQRNGLNHLVAISGLHVGIMYAVGWFVGGLLLRLDGRFHFAPMLCGVAIASFYAYLAGFSVPTLRALLMCLLVNILLLSNVRLTKTSSWLLILALLLLIWPQAAIDPSLWLSMYAVAIIMLFLSFRLFDRSAVLKAIGLQICIVGLMFPIIALVFGGISATGLLYNLVFVPWFSLIVVPITFLALASAPWSFVAERLWWCSDWSLNVVVKAVDFSLYGWLPISQAQLSILVVMLVLLVISVWLDRKAILLAMIIAFLGLTDWQPRWRWQLNVFDVGHGLAVAIVQGNRAFLYDTGASWQTSSYVQQLLNPWFRYRGVTELDYFFVSHFDNDHSGGWKDVLQTWQPNHFVTSQHLAISQPCTAGRVWQWGVLEIEALWPPVQVSRAYNPQSCVLKLTDKESKISLLLPGDIEKIAEWMLLKTADKLNSDIVLAPHHGSRSSSGKRFIDAVSAQLAIGSSAFHGRWNLPSKEVVQAYRNQGSEWLDTGSSGQIMVNFYSDQFQVRQLRQLKGRAWYRQMLRKGVE